jgi:hypothetical protein
MTESHCSEQKQNKMRAHQSFRLAHNFMHNAVAQQAAARCSSSRLLAPVGAERSTLLSHCNDALRGEAMNSLLTCCPPLNHQLLLVLGHLRPRTT